MGPNSELRSSSLKIRRKHFLSTIFRRLRINLGKNRTKQSTSIINLFAKVLQACSYLHDSNKPHQAYNRMAQVPTEPNFCNVKVACRTIKFSDFNELSANLCLRGSISSTAVSRFAIASARSAFTWASSASSSVTLAS